METGRHFLSSCSEVNSTGYTEFYKPSTDQLDYLGLNEFKAYKGTYFRTLIHTVKIIC